MTHKYGKIETNQRYKCVRCGKQFRSKYQLTIDADTLWKQYYEGKQTYLQLATQYGCSCKTIQRKIDTGYL